MKHFYILLVIYFLNLHFINAQTTFDWDTNATDNGDNVTETINGITVTFTGPNTETTILNIYGYGGSSGKAVIISNDDLTSNEVTFSFSEPVDVASILALEGNESDIDYTFTPTGGTNSPITASLIEGAASVTLNWSGITSFSVTSNDALFGFDDLVINNTPTSSTNEFTLKNTNVFPNPSSDFIIVNGLTTIENYIIYNSIGQEISRGIIFENKKIDIQELSNGIYILKLENRNSIKFIKE